MRWSYILRSIASDSATVGGFSFDQTVFFKVVKLHGSQHFMIYIHNYFDVLPCFYVFSVSGVKFVTIADITDILVVWPVSCAFKSLELSVS